MLLISPMPILAPQPSFEVSGVYRFDNQEAWGAESLNDVDLEFEGILGDRHYGLTRVVPWYENEALARSVVFNDKSISIVSAQDMKAVAEGLNLAISMIEERAELNIAHFMTQVFAANALLNTRGPSLNNTLTAGALVAFADAFSSHFSDQKTVIKATEYNNPCKKPFSKLLEALRQIGLRPEEESAVLYDKYKEVARYRRMGWFGSCYWTPGCRSTRVGCLLSY